jgi:hypothetical protein
MTVKATSKAKVKSSKVVFDAVACSVKDINATELYHFEAGNTSKTSDGMFEAKVKFDVRKDLNGTKYKTAAELGKHVIAEIDKAMSDGSLDLDLTAEVI